MQSSVFCLNTFTGVFLSSEYVLLTGWIHPWGTVMFSSHVEERWEMQSCLNVWTKHTGSPGLWEFQWILTIRFQISRPDKHLFCDLIGQKTFLTFLHHYYCFCLYYCLHSVCGPTLNFWRRCSSGVFVFVHIAGQDLTFDSTGRRSYMEACEKLQVVPSSAFLRQIRSNEMLLMHRCLGPQVSCNWAEAFFFFDRIFPSWI